MKRLSFTLFILVIVLAIEAVLLMLLSGTLLNSVRLPIIDNADFIWLLITNNPWLGFLELINQPLLIMGAEHTAAGDFSVALFYYLPGSLLHLLLAFWIARYAMTKKRVGMKGFVTGLVLLLLTLPNIWLASCCGDVPGWSVDVGLRQYVFAQGGDTIARLAFYETMLPLLLPLRLIVGATGLGLVWRRLSH